MTNREDPLPRSGQLRDEAADWFATMRGPDADARRPEFEAWLARGALHRSAYNGIAETFSLGKALKPEGLQKGELPKAEGETRKRPGRLVLIVTLSIATLAGALSLIRSQNPESGVHRLQLAVSEAVSVQLSTRVGEISMFSLSDGSRVTLDTDSLLAVAFTKQQRGLRLMRGRGRFIVAHSERPFIVRAGLGSITARGTVFDVAFTTSEDVRVRLLRGAVDVEMPLISPDGHRITHTKHMAPGEQLAFGTGISQVEAATSGAADITDNWTELVRDFDHIRLADLVLEANRYAMTPISLSASDLGNLRVSGTFRLKDTVKLADNLAAMLDLHVVATAVDRRAKRTPLAG
jgi:transmembrane sensor